MAEQLPLDFDAPKNGPGSGFKPDPELTTEERAVWDCIKDRKGKGNEILGTVIARRTGMDYRTVRAVIADLMNRKGRLIGSNSRGYYVPVTKEEVYEVTKSLRHRGIMILVRAARLMGNSLEDVFHQGRMEYGETSRQHTVRSKQEGLEAKALLPTADSLLHTELPGGRDVQQA